MKRILFLFCGLLLSQIPLHAATVPVPSSWQDFPVVLWTHYEPNWRTSYAEGVVHEPITEVRVTYFRRLDAIVPPRIVLYVDGVERGVQVTHDDELNTLVFPVRLPYSEQGHVIRVGASLVGTLVDYTPFSIWGVSTWRNAEQLADIYYFDNPKYDHDTCRHELPASSYADYAGWRAHRIFTPGAWEPFCLPLTPDRVYTHEEDGTEVDLLPSTYQHPDGHYWIRSFRDPCPESQVGSNWLIPSELSVPEAGVGYILMLPDDLWWIGREICFEGRFSKVDGRSSLTDEYDESMVRMATAPLEFTYLPNTTFVSQQVGEGWLPNVAETMGRYFDNHHDPYTLHPMECHLIGGFATTGIARIGTRNVSTDIDDSSSNLPLPGEGRGGAFLMNGHIVILRNAHSYDLLGHPIAF